MTTASMRSTPERYALPRTRGLRSLTTVEVGKPAPTFTLASDSGEEVSLESLRGRPVVLYFYPKDDTPGS
jgi:cytochrome oxidase Cu insertion factor (SCO1/SenC/PrrC family)